VRTDGTQELSHVAIVVGPIALVVSGAIKRMNSVAVITWTTLRTGNLTELISNKEKVWDDTIIIIIIIFIIIGNYCGSDPISKSKETSAFSRQN
jgi:hypothetical protein